MEDHDGIVTGQPLCSPFPLALFDSRAPWRNSGCGRGLRVSGNLLALHLIDDGCSLTQGWATAPEHALEQLAGIGKQMKAVGDLDGTRCALACTIGIGAGTITADHLDTGVLSQPHRQALGSSIRKQGDGTPTFEIDQD